MKKGFAAVTLAVSLAFGQTAYAAYYDINDVPWDGAQEYINNVDSLGIMQGGENSEGQLVFRAYDDVTYNECMQIIYSLLEKAGGLISSEDFTSKWESVLNTYNIPDSSKRATAYMLENGFVTLEELQAFNPDWAVNGAIASKEAIAVFMGRAFVATGEFPSLVFTSKTGFNDDDEFTESYATYINLLREQGVITGGNDGNFHPKAGMSRADMAAVAYRGFERLSDAIGGGQSQAPVDATEQSAPQRQSNEGSGSIVTELEQTEIPSPQSQPPQAYRPQQPAQAYQPPSSIVVDDTPKRDVGVVSAIKDFGGSYIISVNKSGKVTGLTADYNVPVTRNGTTVGLSMIKEGDTISYTYTNSRINSIAIDYASIGQSSGSQSTGADDGRKESKYEGEIVSFGSNRIGIESLEGNIYRYDLVSQNDLRITIDSTSSDYATLNKRFSDGEYLYAILSLDGSGDVESINVDVSASKDGNIKGDVTYLTESKIGIQSNNRAYRYDLVDPDDLVVVINSRKKNIDDLMDYYEDREFVAELTLNGSNKVKRVEVVSSSGTGYKDSAYGKLKGLSTSSATLRDGGEDKRYYYADKNTLTVKIDGRASTLSRLSDIFEEDEYTLYATLELDKNYQITAMDVETDDYDRDDDEDEETEGELFGLTSSKVIIRVDGRKHTYTLADEDDLKIYIDGSKSKYDELKDMFDENYEIYVELSFDGRKVDRIDAETSSDDSPSSGYIQHVSRRSITIKKNGRETEYDVAEEDKLSVTIDGKRADIADLKDAADDDDVYVYLKFNSRGEVKTIRAEIE